MYVRTLAVLYTVLYVIYTIMYTEKNLIPLRNVAAAALCFYCCFKVVCICPLAHCHERCVHFQVAITSNVYVFCPQYWGLRAGEQAWLSGEGVG